MAAASRGGRATGFRIRGRTAGALQRSALLSLMLEKPHSIRLPRTNVNEWELHRYPSAMPTNSELFPWNERAS
jgi:hypothetical protein